MVKIRLTRGGTKKSPFYRVVAIDSRKPREGRASEFLGTYHPVSRVQQLNLKEEEILTWLEKGAQPSGTARDILKKAGILQKHNAKVTERNKAKKAKAKQAG